MKQSLSATPSWKQSLEDVRVLAAQSGTKKRALLSKINALEVAIESEIDHLEDTRRRRIIGPRARVRTAI